MASRKFNPNFSDILIRSREREQPERVKITTKSRSTSWQPGIRILPEEVEEFDNQLYLDFLGFVAQEYKSRLEKAILSQEFLNKWPPLNKDYKRWKERAGLDPRIWIRSGQFLDAIRVRFLPNRRGPTNNLYAVGVDESVRYREVVTVKDSSGNVVNHRLGQRTDISVAWVSRLMEFGTSKMPARPLFGPVQKKLSKNIRPIAEDWIRQNNIDIEID